MTALGRDETERPSPTPESQFWSQLSPRSRQEVAVILLARASIPSDTWAVRIKGSASSNLIRVAKISEAAECLHNVGGDCRS